MLVQGGLDLFSVFHLLTCILKSIREQVAVVRRCLANEPAVERFVLICTYRNYMEVTFSQGNSVILILVGYKAALRANSCLLHRLSSQDFLK